MQEGGRMKRLSTFTRNCVLSISCLAALGAYSAYANDDVYCGMVVTSDFTLSSNLLDCPQWGLIVGSDNITLNGRGHVLGGITKGDGSGGGFNLGILLRERSGLTIKNFVIQHFGEGVTGYEASNNLIYRNKFLSNDVGLYLYDESLNNVIRANTFRDNRVYAMTLEDARNSAVISNKMVRNKTGIGLWTSHDSIVKNNILNHNEYGMEIGKSDRVDVIRNKVKNSHYYGIMIYLDDSIVVRNEAINNCSGDGTSGYAGVYITGGINTEFLRNRSVGNNCDGFKTTNAWREVADNNFINNISKDNSGYGFYDDTTGGIGTAGTDNTYIDNKCARNGIADSLPDGLCD